MKSNNVIEINGNLYDAKSGLPLNGKTTAKKTAHIKKIAPNQVKTIDGFSRRTSIPVSNKVSLPKQPVEKKQPTQLSKERTHTPSPSMKRPVSRSLTLNRNAVKQPTKIVAKNPVNKPSIQEAALSSTALKHADSARFKRASEVTKSSSVVKFNHTTAPQTDTTSTNTTMLSKHLANTHELPDSPEQKSTKERLIEKAMANTAITHSTKHKKTKKHSHLGRYATSGLVALILVGYVAYLNVPSISMKVAAHRAGFAAAMPGYKPAGYSLKGPIAYSPGQVTVNFQSNTDNRTFSLKQQPTTWDSTALLENYVVKQNPNYLTYQDRGLTIYIYEGNSASWVNGGKLYNLEAKDAQLDTDQLLKLATSV